MKNIATGKYLTASGNFDNPYRANTLNVGVAASILTADNQKWDLVLDGSMYKLNSCTGKGLLNPYGSNAANGDNICLWDSKDGDTTQRWSLEQVSGGYVIRNVYSSGNVVAVDGNNVALKTYSAENGNQIWAFETEHWVDVNLTLDGEDLKNGLAQITFDVYINGSRVKDDVTDYCAKHFQGTTYEVKDIRASGAYAYVGAASYSGAVGTQDAVVKLPILTQNYTPELQKREAFNGHEYEFYTCKNILWTEAKAFAEEKGGYMVTITSAEEQSFIKSNVTGTCWLGASDAQKESEWKWVTGEAFQYQNWGDSEPNNTNGIEHYCGMIYSTGLWNDYSVGSTAVGSFIVEYNSPCANGHAWGAWTKLDDEQHQRVCSRDPSHVETEDHSWDNGETDGVTDTYTCTVCGATKTEPHEHYFIGMGGIIDTPTCTEPGHRERTCPFCHQTFIFEIPPTDHAYGDWVKLNDAQHQRICAYDASHVETEAHVWNEGVENGSVRIYTCTECGAVKEAPLTSDAVITVATVKAMPGATVDVAVDLTQYAPMSYLLLGLDYDKTALTLTEVKNGGLFDTFENGANLLLSAGDDIAAAGNILTLTFTVSENAAAGEYPVTVTCRQCCNNEEDVLFVDVVNGKITVIDVMIGDVNGDNVIDGRDLIRLRKYLANLNEETGESTAEITAGADCTGDGIVDGRDLIRLRKYLANLNEETGESTVTLG